MMHALTVGKTEAPLQTQYLSAILITVVMYFHPASVRANKRALASTSKDFIWEQAMRSWDCH